MADGPLDRSHSDPPDLFCRIEDLEAALALSWQNEKRLSRLVTQARVLLSGAKAQVAAAEARADAATLRLKELDDVLSFTWLRERDGHNSHM